MEDLNWAVGYFVKAEYTINLFIIVKWFSSQEKGLKWIEQNHKGEKDWTCIDRPRAEYYADGERHFDA